MTKLKDYRMDKNFEMIGLWSNDYGDFDNAINGTLFYTKSGIELQLFDIIENNDKKEFDIYGFSQDGKLVWLRDCYLKTNTWSAPGFSIEKYGIRELYIFEVEFNYFSDNDFITAAFNRILNNNSNISIEKLIFSTNNLYEWFGGIIPEDNTEEYIYKISKETLKVRFGVEMNLKRNLNKDIKTLDGQLIISSMNNQNIDFQSALKTSTALKKLLELFCQKPLHYNYIQFNVLTVEKKINGKIMQNYPIIKGHYFINQIGSQNTEFLKNSYFLFRDLHKEFDQLLASWFNKEHLLEFIVNDYLSDLYMPNYIEPKLLNSIRNLEVYYRNFVEEPIEDPSMSEDRNNIINYIEENINTENKFKMLSRLNYPDRTSLSKKLKKLIKDLPEELFDHLEIKEENKSPSDSINSFVNRLVETRNYYTHGDNPQNYPHRITEAHEFYESNQKIRVIIMFYIYLELAIDKELILENMLQLY